MSNNIDEIWIDIVGFEGLYQVSNLGRVKSLNYNREKKEKILKLKLVKNGYYRICLCKNNKPKWYSVHRLVAIAFIPNPNNLPQVNHIDEDKTNNCVDNLEWCNQKYNVNYGTALERRSKNTDYQKIMKKIDFKKRTENTDFKKRTENTDYKKIAEKLKNRKDLSKPILQLDLEENIINEFPSTMEAERQTGFNQSNISNCLKGKRKTCGGFIWKYKD